MPRSDPILSPSNSGRRRFWRILGLLTLLSLVVAALAAILVARGDSHLHVHMIVATALGAFLTMLIGSGLMTLLFISSSSGHDEAAARFHQENDDQ